MPNRNEKIRDAQIENILKQISDNPGQIEDVDPDSLQAACEIAYRRAKRKMRRTRPELAHRAGILAVFLLVANNAGALRSQVEARRRRLN